MLSLTSLIKTTLTKQPIITRSLFQTTVVLQNQDNADKVVLEERNITKDRTEQIPVETSIRYLQSKAYQQTYGDQPVWVPYRRNHKGLYPPKKTRRTCIRGGEITTASPCPICRDEYLILDENNLDLLKQFICPHTGSILSYNKTGLCQKKHQLLLVTIKRAQNKGLLTYDVPFRKYNYADYV